MWLKTRRTWGLAISTKRSPMGWAASIGSTAALRAGNRPTDRRTCRSRYWRKLISLMYWRDSGTGAPASRHRTTHAARSRATQVLSPMCWRDSGATVLPPCIGAIHTPDCGRLRPQQSPCPAICTGRGCHRSDAVLSLAIIRTTNNSGKETQEVRDS